MKKNIDKVKKGITDALELPLDIALDLPKITMVGNLKVDITNHKGIIEYKKEIIRINTNIGIVKITGDSLEIKNILIEEINIDGNIENIEIMS
ncbi:sporulation protein YqfC [Tissierella creatinophila]|uniref:YabP family protein n=1 Tax=Tissierella creatinophila DSM 6911 TaxID=1123403 RepID=A0A1U7M7W6_TISCR|nr:sporulation protein YqfC [Tissierella creatinophila]OLS03376.1 YabP family protein [Tissierella creatinophila DSM 6911]